jgi:metal-responsive CopG/Arc/MetJ family transcriptional regulator
MVEVIDFMFMADEDKKLVHMLFDATLLKRLDDFRFKNRFANRTEAIKWLLDWALSQKPSRKE